MDLIDITSLVGWGIFDNCYICIFFDQSCFLVRGEKLTFLGGYQNSHPMPALLSCHRLNIDRCMINIDRCTIKASDHDMLVVYFTPEMKQTCYDLMTDSEKCCKINNY